VAVYRFKFRILWDRAGRSRLSIDLVFRTASGDLPEKKDQARSNGPEV